MPVIQVDRGRILPAFTTDFSGPAGTYWFLVNSNSAPYPFNPHPELPVFSDGSVPGTFVIDDRLVDWEAVQQALALDQALHQMEVQLGLAEATGDGTRDGLNGPLGLE